MSLRDFPRLPPLATSAISAAPPTDAAPTLAFLGRKALRPLATWSATTGSTQPEVAAGRKELRPLTSAPMLGFEKQAAEVAEVAGSVSRRNPSDDPFLIPTCDGGSSCIPLELPPLDAPLGKCRGCTFIAPLSERKLCGNCEHRRQTEGAA
jgi:hypothetical protein